MNKRWGIWFSAPVLAATLVACGDSGDESTEGANGESFVIGATQILEHPSLDAAYDGFQDAIEEAGLDVDYTFQSAQGDQNNTSTIANNFVSDGVDLIFANSTPSAISALQATQDIPIVFTSVTDPVGAGLVEGFDQPGENITGVSDLHPEAIDMTIQFIDEHFADSTVGLIYNTGESNSVVQVDAIKEAASGTSLSTVERTVATSADVQSATASLAEEADVIYLVTDNTVISALETIVGISNEQGIALVASDPDSLEKGAFAAYGTDFYTLGYQTGEKAVAILTGEQTPSEIPVESPAEINLVINREAAEAQGIEWKDEWDLAADAYESTK
ncbi:ABC transporter substrate-binding protein [Alkalicoccobacillus murimartini]|uniref:ABC transport system substrate-binding protein n=1 Tax=Alkalicoccobacillus murimartini TaxID=171685 RepID=A0ABT9YEU7_9BACI|nr:ABC transporter substrate-binding protein [Alkalicoccobacillus murimartini]MDQ0206025.1 putative ABC transport system substrate-binding protein [Alkalicoccobacillus murimartini]